MDLKRSVNDEDIFLESPLSCSWNASAINPPGSLFGRSDPQMRFCRCLIHTFIFIIFLYIITILSSNSVTSFLNRF